MTDSKTFKPFPGLRPFGAEEDYLFFGREEQIRELLQLLRTHRFLAVVGTSGSGKSSLVRAGLLPALYGGTMVGAGSDWSTVVFRPGGDPLLKLAEAIVEADLYESDDEETPFRVRATLSRSRLGLVQSIRQSDLPEGTNLLIVVDQFEELFRFRDTSPDHQGRATAFVKLLLNAVADPDLPVYVVITMRSDYLGECAQLPGLAEAVNDGEYLIPKLTRDQKRDAIEKPVSVGGGQISPALVQQLLNDVGDDSDQLPILQHALMRIWDKWEVDAESEPIDIHHYDSVGGMTNALSLHADEVYDELPDDNSRAIARCIFQAITERSEDERGTRRPTQLGHLCRIVNGGQDEVAVVLDAYREAGRTFVMPGQNMELQAETVIDISHESLMRVWQRLRGWVAEESQAVRIYRRLAETAALHAADQAGVYRDPDLQIATSWRDVSEPTEAWAQRYHTGFDTAMTFLDQSWETAHAEEEAREAARQRELRQARELAESQERLAQEQAASARRFRRQFQVSGVIAIIAVAASIIAFYSMSVARKNESIARAATDDALQSQKELAASYRKESIEASQEAFELGDLTETLRSLETGYRRDTTDVEFVRLAMNYVSQVNLSRLLYRKPLTAPARQYVRTAGLDALGYVTPDNVLHVVAHSTTEDGAVTIANIPVTGRVSKVFVNESSVRVVEQKGRSILFDRDSNQVTPIIQLNVDSGPSFEAQSPEHVSLTRGHSLLAANSKVILVEHAAAGDIVTDFIIPDDPQITHVQLSEDGNTALFATRTQGYLVYDLTATASLKRRIANDSSVLSVAYLALQNQFLTLESSGLMVLTSVEDEALDIVHMIPLSGVKKSSISPDGTRLAILDPTGALSVYSLIDGQPLSISKSLTGVPVDDFSFDPLGLFLVVVDENNQLLSVGLNGDVSLMANIPIQVAPNSLGISWLPLPAKSRHKRLCIQFVQRSAVQESPAICCLEIRRTAADSEASTPSWSDLTFENLEASDATDLFAFLRQLTELSLPNAAPPTHPSFSPFMAWINRHDSASAMDDLSLQRRTGQSVERVETAPADQTVDFLDIVLRKQMNSELLSQGMAISTESSPVEVATRYHLIKHLQKAFAIPQTSAFSEAMLQHIAKQTRLLEIRSQDYRDRVAEGEPVNLTAPHLIDQWDGLSHCWKLNSPTISLKETRRWPATNNQYLTWKGGHFSDYRIQFDLVKLSGNSGIDNRSIPLDDLGDVFQANYLHPYLRKGYQADLVGSASRQPGNFHGKTINDNYRRSRPLVLADRGETVLIEQNSQPLKLARSGDVNTVEVLEKMHEIEANRKLGLSTGSVRVTVELRGNHLTFHFGDLLMNHIYDCQNDRVMSGEIAIQAVGANTELIYEKFSLIPLGRDIAEAELALSDGVKLPHELNARLMASRKQWYALEPFLEQHAEEAWAADVEREMNLSRRSFHRRLARASIANNTDALQEIIHELGDSELLNEIAHSDVGDAGFGSIFGTPMMSAAIHGSTDALAVLADNGVSLDERHGIYRSSPMDAACFGNQPKTVQFFLERGCDVMSVNVAGYTALHEAAKWSGPDVIRHLLNAEVEINAQNNRDFSALQELADIKRNAREFGNTDYAAFATSDRRIEVARLFMTAGMDPLQNVKGRPSALDLAEQNGDVDLVDLFMNNQQ